MSGENKETIQAAKAIIACGPAVRQAILHDPSWQRRRTHGDPTAIPDLVGTVCDQQGLVAKVVLATIAADPALSTLLTQTIALAQSQAEQELAHDRRWKLALAIGIPLAVLIIIIAYLGLQVASNVSAKLHGPQPPGAGQ